MFSTGGDGGAGAGQLSLQGCQREHERAQLLQAQKNLENSGNPLPRIMILDSFLDEHLGEVLGESGVEALGGSDRS